VQGNGQTELVEALTGLTHPLEGSIVVSGRDLTYASPRLAIETGVAHVPEDRQRDGLVAEFPVADNLVLNQFDQEPYAHGLSMDRGAIATAARERVREFDIRTPSIDAAAGTLSGGNQQKIIVAREFSRHITLLVASQPTRGLDVGSVQYIHERIVKQRDEGLAVLIVSSELDEVLALADRIAVMYRGRMAGPFEASTMTRERLGLLMAGAEEDGAGGDGSAGEPRGADG
jgi:general nucleoside transport system ATP-binding protein